LKGGDWLDRLVERLGPRIPENLGPEVPMEASCDLVRRCRKDDETGQVVLDESSHFVEVFFFFFL